jgi:Ras-related protein Rab-1A
MSLSDIDETITYKIILIGDSSVGKTCLFKKLTTGVYSDKNISTIGIDRKSISLKIKVIENGVELEKTFVIQIWDTAGQERFRSITKGYFQDSQGLLLLYDITNKDTFDNLDKWISSVKDSLGDDDKEKDKYIIILLGNKLDLAVGEDRRVTTEEAMKKCEECDIIWGGECSAKDFTVEDLTNKFETYTKEIYRKIGCNVQRDSTATKAVKNERKKCAC